jgi:5,10-methylenetetrahydrofolate reductase
LCFALRRLKLDDFSVFPAGGDCIAAAAEVEKDVQEVDAAAGSRGTARDDDDASSRWVSEAAEPLACAFVALVTVVDSPDDDNDDARRC